MTIVARYPGKCARCGARINPGEQIDWDKATKTISHITCPDAKTAPAQSETPTYTISGGSGYGCYGWKPGQVIRNKQRNIDAGEPEWLYVLDSRESYFPEDGMSFGVGDDRGYVYRATCREATEDESRPEREALAARQAAKQRLEMLRQIADEIRTNGEYPGGDNAPAGETVPIGKGQDVYGGGEWFVIGTEHIWYVRNNGSDGDDWSANNVRTGGAGAIGWRVAYTADLAARIRG